MRKIAVILAGGEGHRAGGDIPKQFRELCGRPMYQWSLEAFASQDAATELVVVCHPGAFDLLDILDREWDLRCASAGAERPVYRLVCGGRTRRESVEHALMDIPSDEEILVAVHDAARPLVMPEMIARGWDTAEREGSAVPVVPVVDSLREKNSDGDTEPVDRARFLAVQTPQIFRADILKRAYSLPDRPEFTDDASMVQALNEGAVALYDGIPQNMKVTVPSDFIIADALLKNAR